MSALPLMSIPSEDDAKLAKETKQILEPRLSATSPLDFREMNPPQEPALKIPASAAHHLVQRGEERPDFFLAVDDLNDEGQVGGEAEDAGGVEAA